MHDLSFRHLYEYDLTKAGISVPVKLKLIEASADCEAKIDTGSTNCIFSRHLGEKLDLKIEDGLPKRIRTATGSFMTFEHRVTLEVLDCEFDFLACFAEDESFQTNVLGRFGFLIQVSLGIVDYEGKIYLSKYGDE